MQGLLCGPIFFGLLQIVRNLFYNDGGDRNGEGTSRMQLTFHGDIAAHGICQQLADRHAESGSGDSAYVPVLLLAERIEDPAEIISGHSDPCILTEVKGHDVRIIGLFLTDGQPYGFT